jgi:hypothetical protein
MVMLVYQRVIFMAISLGNSFSKAWEFWGTLIQSPELAKL